VGAGAGVGVGVETATGLGTMTLVGVPPPQATRTRANVTATVFGVGFISSPLRPPVRPIEGAWKTRILARGADAGKRAEGAVESQE
jgi:hypothetical protein